MIDSSAQKIALGPHKSTLNFLEWRSSRIEESKVAISTEEYKDRVARSTERKSGVSDGGGGGGEREFEWRKEVRSGRERDAEWEP